MVLEAKQFFECINKTASVSVLLGNESEWATATKYIFVIVISVYPKFYETMNKGPLLLSTQVKNKKKFNKPPGPLSEPLRYLTYSKICSP